MCTLKKGGDWSPNPPPGSAGVYHTRFSRTIQLFTFNRLNSQYNSSKFKANKKKLYNVPFGQILLNLQSKLVTDDVIKNVCDVIHFDVSSFWFASKALTLISNFTNQYVIFSQRNGNDVTSNDVINFKEKNFNPELEN